MITDPIDACRFWLHDTTVPFTFTNAQIQEFLDLEKVIDQYGYKPDNVLWSPTYDVIRAAGRGWFWLAGVMGTGRTLSYRVGDVSVQFDRNFALQRGRELMGAASGTAQRRDEQTEPDVLARYREEP